MSAMRRHVWLALEVVPVINLERLREYPVISVDMESTGLHWYRDKMFGVALAARDGDHIVSGYWDIREKPRILEVLKAELPKCARIVNHAIKTDAHFMREAGMPLPLEKVECTMVRAALIDEHLISGREGYNLDSLCRKYLNKGKVDIYAELAALFGGAPTRAQQMKNLHRAPSALVAKYAAPDPALALELWEWQEKEIERQSLHKVWTLEKRLTPVLVRIEQGGVRVDEELAAERAKKLASMERSAQMALDMINGKPLNANSPPQMRMFFKVAKDSEGKWRVNDGKGLEVETTDGGEASINKDMLKVLEGQGDPRAKLVLDLRKYDKAQQFLNDHILGHAVKRRVFCNYNQTKGENEKGTGTGRLSIDDPALQQIPARDADICALVRSCFLPEEGHNWASADWEQFEFRWFAHYTEDKKIAAVYSKNPKADFHATVADITGIPRNPRYAGDANAKQINLGLVFGMGQGTMAYEMGLEYTTDQRGYRKAGPKAMEIFDKYHTAIPGVRKLLDQASSIARSRGYVRDLMDRHIRFPAGKFVHKAAGLVFQATSASAMKLKMIELDEVCQKEGSPYLLSVHDEHNVSIPKSKTKTMSPRIKAILECFDGVNCEMKCDIPILSSVGVGANWFDAGENA